MNETQELQSKIIMLVNEIKRLHVLLREEIILSKTYKEKIRQLELDLESVKKIS